MTSAVVQQSAVELSLVTLHSFNPRRTASGLTQAAWPQDGRCTSEKTSCFTAQFLCTWPACPVRLAVVPEYWAPDVSDNALSRTIARNSPMCSDSYVIVPCIPAREISFQASAASIAARADVAAWPAVLRSPQIRTPGPNEGEPKAVASGRRSALVKLGGQWCRLKGCGDEERGFTVREQENRASGRRLK